MLSSSTCAPEDSAHTLLQAARAGSLTAWGELLEKHRGYLFAIAARELAEEACGAEHAADLVQDTFLEAQRDFCRFRGETNGELLRWLRGVLRHNVTDFHRRCRAERRQAIHEVSLDSLHGKSLRDQLYAESSLPEESLVEENQLERLWQALESLPADYRQVIILRHIDGGRWSDVASCMNRSIDAAQRLWGRAIVRLRRQVWRDAPRA